MTKRYLYLALSATALGYAMLVAVGWAEMSLRAVTVWTFIALSTAYANGADLS